MNRYKQCFVISAIIITVPSVMPFIYGIVTLNLPQVLIFGGGPGLWWLACSRLHRSQRGSFAFSLSLAGLACCALLARLVERRVFVTRNGGMERADGYGSPMAFLIGLAFEVFFFLLFALVTWRGVVAILENRRQSNQEAG